MSKVDTLVANLSIFEASWNLTTLVGILRHNLEIFGQITPRQIKEKVLINYYFEFTWSDSNHIFGLLHVKRRKRAVLNFENINAEPQKRLEATFTTRSAVLTQSRSINCCASISCAKGTCDVHELSLLNVQFAFREQTFSQEDRGEIWQFIAMHW